MAGPLVFTAIRGFVRMVPLAAGERAAAAIGTAWGRFDRSKRRAVRRNLLPILEPGRPIERAADRVFARHAQLLFEMFRGPSNDDISFSIEGAPILDAASARGRGVVLALPHLGNWEIAGCRLAARGTPVTSVAGIQLSASWTREIRRLRAEKGLGIVAPNRAGLRALDEALARGEVVALHVDGDRFRSGIPAIVAGRCVEFPTGPARLAARHRAALVYGFCSRRDDGSQVGRVVREIPISDQGREAIHAATLELARLFEATVRERPEEWTMFRDFFSAKEAA